MFNFRFVVYYKEVAVYQSFKLKFADLIQELSRIIEYIYEFNGKFGDHIFETCEFSYVIEDVDYTIQEENK